MVHGVSVFAPVVEVDAQSRVSQPVTTLNVTTPAAGSVCSLQLFFNMCKSLETLVHHRAKLQGLLAVSCECAAHSEILNRLFNLKLSSSEPSGGSSQVHF